MLRYGNIIELSTLYSTTEACAACGLVYASEVFAARGRVYTTGVAPVLVFTIASIDSKFKNNLLPFASPYQIIKINMFVSFRNEFALRFARFTI